MSSLFLFPQVWDKFGASLSGCASPSSTCTDLNGARIGANTFWTPTETEVTVIAVDTFCAGSLSSYTLAVTGSGDSCTQCPCSGPWKNHGKYVSCVAQEAGALVDAGDITDDEKDEIVAIAAESSCGRRG